MKKTILLLFLFGFLAQSTWAQTPSPAPAPAPPSSTTTSPSPVVAGIWRCELPGGVFNVALRAIASVSSHEYVVDQLARVTELTIDTGGSVVARFYYIEPNKPSLPSGAGQTALDKFQEQVREGIKRVGQEGIDPTSQDKAWAKVIKSYPSTTHAHTVEYRVQAKSQIEEILKSVEKSWRTGEGAVFKVKDN